MKCPILFLKGKYEFVILSLAPFSPHLMKQVAMKQEEVV